MSAEWPTAGEWLASGTTAERAGGPVDPIVVAGIPLSQGAVTPSRYDLAPSAIRAAMERISSYDAERGVDLSLLPVIDLGDDLTPPPLTAPLTLLIGGHNGITFESLSRSGDLSSWGLLTVDAHHDAREYEPGRPGNGSPVRALVDAGLPGENIVQVGIAPLSNALSHRIWCEEQGITIRAVDAIAEVPVLLDSLARRCDHIYVDLDIDVLDRSFAPGCPGARPGGISPRELFDAAFYAGSHNAVSVVDFVEVNPETDFAQITVLTAAMALLNVVAGFASRRT